MTRIQTKNGTPISRLGFGAMQFGRTADVGNAKEMFEIFESGKPATSSLHLKAPPVDKE